ncbi:MAG: SDR family oxidoreductase [Natrialbaceae archaeon]|nr:SDR family oxidoreductase [Natrialbaceae archaeon]
MQGSPAQWHPSRRPTRTSGTTFFDVNVVGLHRTATAALLHLRSADQASIVNISSIGGKRPYPNRAPYAASKMAVIGLTRTLAFELGDDDITVNAICPGPVEGDRIQRAFEGQAAVRGVSAEAIEHVATSRLAIEELVPPAEVAALAVHLASEQARHITGQDMNVSSGGAWYVARPARDARRPSVRYPVSRSTAGSYSRASRARSIDATLS